MAGNCSTSSQESTQQDSCNNLYIRDDTKRKAVDTNEVSAETKKLEIQKFHVEKVICKCMKPRDDNGLEDWHYEVEFPKVEVPSSDIPWMNEEDEDLVPSVSMEEWETKQLKRVDLARKTIWKNEFCPHCKPYVTTLSRYNLLKRHIKLKHPGKVNDPFYADRRKGVRELSKRGGRRRHRRLV